MLARFASGLACIGLVLVLLGADSCTPGPLVLVVMGDTQTWAANIRHPDGNGEFPSGVTSHATWIQTNEALCAQKEEKGIHGVVFVGDVVNFALDPLQWDRASQALDVLDGCNLPYYLIPGNHDAADGDWSAYLDFFAARGFQPPMIAPSGLSHLTYLGNDWLLLGTRYTWLTAADADWYDSIIAQLPPVKVIVTNHDFISRSDFVFRRAAAEAFVDARPEIEFGIYGHFCCGVVRRAFHETALPSGGSIVSLFNNDQDNFTLHGWTTWVELTSTQICMEAWHPVTDQRGYEAISSSQLASRAASPPRTCFAL